MCAFGLVKVAANFGNTLLNKKIEERVHLRERGRRHYRDGMERDVVRAQLRHAVQKCHAVTTPGHRQQDALPWFGEPGESGMQLLGKCGQCIAQLNHNSGLLASAGPFPMLIRVSRQPGTGVNKSGLPDLL